VSETPAGAVWYMCLWACRAAGRLSSGRNTRRRRHLNTPI